MLVRHTGRDLTILTGLTRTVHFAVIDHCDRMPTPRDMTALAVFAGGDMMSASRSRSTAIMTFTTRALYRRVIDLGHGLPCRHGVATFTDLGGTHVRGRFTKGLATVMTLDTGLIQISVINMRHNGKALAVTLVTGLVGRNMAGRRALCQQTVVAIATTRDGGLIDARTMTVLTRQLRVVGAQRKTGLQMIEFDSRLVGERQDRKKQQVSENNDQRLHSLPHHDLSGPAQKQERRVTMQRFCHKDKSEKHQSVRNYFGRLREKY